MTELWSFSRLQLYTRCPAAWASKYRDRLPEQTSPAAVRGQQVHEFVEAYSRHCFAAKMPTDFDEGRRLLASYSEEVQAVGEVERTVLCVATEPAGLCGGRRREVPVGLDAPDN